MPRFSLRSLILTTALLMVFIAVLSQAPQAILMALSIPGVCSLFFLPFAAAKLLFLLGDPLERNFQSDDVQNCLWTIFICLVTASPVIACIVGVIIRL